MRLFYKQGQVLEVGVRVRFVGPAEHPFKHCRREHEPLHGTVVEIGPDPLIKVYPETTEEKAARVTAYKAATVVVHWDPCVYAWHAERASLEILQDPVDTLTFTV